MTHEDFMRQAIALSLDNVRTGKGGPFGAVVVRDGKVLGASGNRVTLDNDPTAHAEVSAIRIACKNIGSFDLTGAVMYTSCEPCPMCLGAIYWSHIREIYFGNTRADAAAAEFDDSLIYDEIPKPLEARMIPAQPLLREEALEAFREWAVSPYKISY